MAYSNYNNYLSNVNKNDINYTDNNKSLKTDIIKSQIKDLESISFNNSPNLETKINILNNYYNASLYNNIFLTTELSNHNKDELNEMMYQYLKKDLSCLKTKTDCSGVCQPNSSLMSCKNHFLKFGFVDISFNDNKEEYKIDCVRTLTLDSCIKEELNKYQDATTKITYNYAKRTDHEKQEILNNKLDKTYYPIDSSYNIFRKMQNAFSDTKNFLISNNIEINNDNFINEFKYQYVKQNINCNDLDKNKCEELLYDNGFYINNNEIPKLVVDYNINCKYKSLNECKKHIKHNLKSSYNNDSINSDMYNEKKELKKSLYRKTGNMFFGITAIITSIIIIYKMK